MRGFLPDLNDKPTCLKILVTSRLHGLYLPFVLLLFIILKAGYLNLPFYWDEAWSYATAVFDMHEKGLAILPGNADAELTRGHPLFFYFLSALWVRLFGTSLTAIHILPLLISCLLLVSIYYFCLKHFNRTTAIIALFLFSVQSVFLAQSTMLLPEILLAWLVIISTYAFLNKNWWLYTFAGILLVLAKESGIILTTAIIIDKLLFDRIFKSKQRMPEKLYWKEFFIICMPAFVFFTYMMIQRIRFGWWFYPEHIEFITHQKSELIPKIQLFYSVLLFQNGRYMLLIVFTICLFGLLYSKRLTQKEKHFMLFSAIFIILYSAFSAVNFFTHRYILSVLPLYIIAGSVVITSFLKERKTILALVTMGLTILFAYQTCFVQQNESDTSLAFKDSVLIQKEMSHYAQDMEWNDKLIYSVFLMQYYLSNPYLGYLNDKTEPFYKVKNIPDLPYELYIFCSNENDPFYLEVSGNDDFILLKHFEKNKAWIEIYKPNSR